MFWLPTALLFPLFEGVAGAPSADGGKSREEKIALGPPLLDEPSIMRSLEACKWVSADTLLRKPFGPTWEVDSRAGFFGTGGAGFRFTSGTLNGDEGLGGA